MIEHYKQKKGKSGIEYAEGNFNVSSNDFYLEGKSLFDPYTILGNDKYHLKLASNKQAIYGNTETNGSNEGLLYAVKLDSAAGEKIFLDAKRKIKK